MWNNSVILFYRYIVHFGNTNYLYILFLFLWWGDKWLNKLIYSQVLVACSFLPIWPLIVVYEKQWNKFWTFFMRKIHVSTQFWQFVTGGQKIEIMVTQYVNMNKITIKAYFHIGVLLRLNLEYILNRLIIKWTDN